MPDYTISLDPVVAAAARRLARGTYQTDLLLGAEAWSGSTLRGSAARSYGASYARSASALLARLTERGIPHRFETIDRRRTLILADAPPARLLRTLAALARLTRPDWALGPRASTGALVDAVGGEIRARYLAAIGSGAAYTSTVDAETAALIASPDIGAARRQQIAALRRALRTTPQEIAA